MSIFVTTTFLFTSIYWKKRTCSLPHEFYIWKRLWNKSAETLSWQPRQQKDLLLDGLRRLLTGLAYTRLKNKYSCEWADSGTQTKWVTSRTISLSFKFLLQVWYEISGLKCNFEIGGRWKIFGLAYFLKSYQNSQALEIILECSSRSGSELFHSIIILFHSIIINRRTYGPP